MQNQTTKVTLKQKKKKLKDLECRVNKSEIYKIYSIMLKLSGKP